MNSLVRAVARVEPRSESAALAALAAFVPGQILDDNYQLVERLGGGGMGIVFRARDRRLGREVAVKMLRPASSGGDEHLRRLFEREARATAQLLHPNIVTLHHVGEHGGHPYLVLELLSGETLSARLARRGKFPVAEALSIVDAVLCALAFAHERGVLHRDLKPNNVFITGDERIKVLDFGVALSLDVDPGPVTRSAGTPGYMAPEQREGGEQDARTDVWAAAQLLVECLLGHRSDQPDASKAVAELDTPAVLRDVLESALSPDPARRPRSATELRLALSRAHGRLAPSVGPPPARWRSALRMIALGLAMAGAGAGTMYLESRSDPPTGPPTAAELSAVAWETTLMGGMRLRIDADGTAYGVYDLDQGVIVGTYHDGVLVGRWCEVPSRQAPVDAGKLEFHFLRGANRLLMDGLWKYGDEPATKWQKDWTGGSIDALDTPPIVALEQRMHKHVLCP